jgi:hypothetical protein
MRACFLHNMLDLVIDRLESIVARLNGLAISCSRLGLDSLAGTLARLEKDARYVLGELRDRNKTC